MTLKLMLARSLVLFTLMHTTWTAVISLPDVSDHHQHHHVSVASSYMHFHGPVEGPEFEVKVPYILAHHSEHNHLLGQDHEDEEHHTHHGYTLDYVAHPKYEFSYGVEDHHTGDFHGQKEVRDGNSVSGEYSVKEPGGSIRVVSYKADKDGFHAVVHTSGKNDHSGGTYSAHAHQGQGHHHQLQVEQGHLQLQEEQGHLQLQEEQGHHHQLQETNEDDQNGHYHYEGYA